MNVSIISGRLTKDIDLKYSTGENATAMARFTIASQRDFKNKDGKYDADFISCQAFGGTAEFLSKYFHKGDAIMVRGSIRTGSYVNKDGNTVYTTDVNVDKVEFGGGKASDNAEASAPKSESTWTPIVDEVSDESLPFN